MYLVSSIDAAIHTSLTGALSEYGNKLLMVSTASASSAVNCTIDIPNGPYFLSVYTGDVFEAYRLYSDYEGAFTEGTIDGAGENLTTLSASIPVRDPSLNSNFTTADMHSGGSISDYWRAVSIVLHQD